MEAYRIENLKFSYANNENRAVLDGVNLTVRHGDFVVICGSSGCGKTTLLRHLKPQTMPMGKKSGAVYFMPRNYPDTLLENLQLRDSAAEIGFVSQCPENQIVTDKVWHELAFGLESLGYETSEIRLKVAEMASFFGIQAWFHKSVTELSGGQKQLLALASVMVMQPSVLILDEPTSQLDPIAAGEFLSIIGKINRELGITVILTEHRLEEAFSLCTTAVVMEQGRIIAQGSPAEVGLKLKGTNGMFAAMPTPMRVWAACETEGESCPVSIREGVQWLRGKAVTITDAESPPLIQAPAVELKDVWFKYGKNAPDIIKGLSFTGHYGEIAAVLGGNGVGKTTMLSLLSGLNLPYRGSVNSSESVYVLPQDPQSLFVAKTVLEDLHEVSAVNTEEIIKLCRLENLLQSHPYDLSGGEQQRAALAKVLLTNPKILLLDEPTKGMDAEYKKTFAEILKALKAQNVAIILVSHDIEFCAEHTDRCALFFDGIIISENTPKKFFTKNSFYTTSANKMARHIIPDAVIIDDIITALGVGERETLGAPPPTPRKPLKRLDLQPPQVANFDFGDRDGDNNPKIKFGSSLFKGLRGVGGGAPKVLFLFLTIPLTIYFGMRFFDDRQFFFISLLIVFQCMLPFVLSFEGRKPQARELVVIAVMVAVGVAGRVAFFMLPQFKPVLAIVVVSGVGLGAEAGFLVGALVAFVSNMYFGHGPWTPWQMFAFGVVGYLSGIIFYRRRDRVRPVTLAAFGGFAALFIYGGIINPASVLMHQPNPTLEMFLLAYFYGFPFDLVHAVATVVFLLVVSRGILDKLGRVF